MKGPFSLFSSVVTLACLSVAGCPIDDAPPGGADSSSSGGSTTMSGSSPTVTPTVTMTDTNVDTANESSSTTTGDMADSTSSTDGDPFVFNEAESYEQVDRIGLPGINTLLISEANRDAYNQSSPAEDAPRPPAVAPFLQDIIDSVTTLHLGTGEEGTGLNDDMGTLGLVACTPPGLPSDTCNDEVYPFVLPDVLGVNVTIEAAFPNGRRPSEPVMDMLLALLLLEVGKDQPITTFLDIDEDGRPGPSLNPLENDVPLPEEFPYLAEAHQ